MLYHEPVMVDEVLEALDLHPGFTAIDGTLGTGGHAIKMAVQIGPRGTLIGLDRDPAMLEIARNRLGESCASGGPRMVFRACSYEGMAGVLAEEGMGGGAEAILLDLGVNSLQLEDAARGFAFLREGPLDGRFNPGEGTRSMADLVNTASERDLTRWLREYSDERLAGPIARRLVAERERASITTTTRLAEIVYTVYPHAQRHKGIHPATRTFQALRIAANDELGAVERGVRASLACLAAGGRLAVISFHSGEDRIVKSIFHEATAPRPDPSNPYSATSTEGIEHELVFRGARKCSEVEASSNPRARSARLRAIRRMGERRHDG